MWLQKRYPVRISHSTHIELGILYPYNICDYAWKPYALRHLHPQDPKLRNQAPKFNHTSKHRWSCIRNCFNVWQQTAKHKLKHSCPPLWHHTAWIVMNGTHREREPNASVHVTTQMHRIQYSIHNSPLKGIGVRDFYMIFIGLFYVMHVFCSFCYLVWFFFWYLIFSHKET